MDIKDIPSGGSVRPMNRSDIQRTQTTKSQLDQNVNFKKGVIDQTEISQSLKKDARILEAAQIVLNALPEFRKDKVELAKKRLADGYYDGPAVRAQIANNILADPEAYPIVPPLSEKESQIIKEDLASGFYSDEAVRNDVVRGMIDDAISEE